MQTPAPPSAYVPPAADPAVARAYVARYATAFPGLPLAEQREETAHALADYIAKGAARLGGELSMDAVDLARVVLAANDGVTLNSLVDGRDVYRPFLRMVIAHIVAPRDDA
mgnify:CR=1 FL=1